MLGPTRAPIAEVSRTRSAAAWPTRTELDSIGLAGPNGSGMPSRYMQLQPEVLTGFRATLAGPAGRQVP